MQFPHNPKDMEEVRQIFQRIHKQLAASSGDTVLKSLFDANTIIKADVDNTPVALTVAEQTLVGRITAGVITALTAAQVKTLLAIVAADIAFTATDKLLGRATSGAGAGEEIALTAAGRALIDDASAAAQRTTLGSTTVGDAVFIAVNAAAGRTALGLGSIATQDANAVAITGGTIVGITDLAVADGGTGASNDADARTNLGLVIGTNVQAYDADLTTWAGLTPSANAQSLVTAADYAAMRALLDLEAGTDFYSKSAADAAFQPKDTQLTAIAALADASGVLTNDGAGAMSWGAGGSGDSTGGLLLGLLAL